MSNSVFPSLPGLTWNVKKSPLWKTGIQQSASGKETRVAYMAYPLWDYELSFEYLPDSDPSNSDLRTLVGFFNTMQGCFDTWLYSDPSDKSVTAQQIGEGDGTTTQFQLIRSYGGFIEPIYDLNGSPVIKIDGVLKTLTTDYTVSSTGLITFVAPPASSSVITATFSYYRRCRFLDDQVTFNQFVKDLWENQTVRFRSVK